MIGVVSRKWICYFSYNQSTEELSSKFNDVYSKFSEAVSQGGVFIIKIIMDQMSFLSNYVMSELKTFLENFATYGLTKFQGKNVVFIIKHVFVVCLLLAEVQHIPTETPTHISLVFTIFLVKQFK